MLQRLLLVFFFAVLPLAIMRASPVPPDLELALKRFQAEGAPGWAFVQTTESAGKNLVEHYNPAKPEFSRWTLLKKDGSPPSESETRDYKDRLSRRTSGGTAPNVKDQLDLASCAVVSDTDDRAIYHFPLKPGGNDDHSAAHMAAVFTLHKPTNTIERVELASFEPFSPVFAIKIAEAKTTLNYSLPVGERPSLLQQITVHIRGRAMWVKSLDQDMVVAFSDHEYVGKKPAPAPAPAAAADEKPARPEAVAP